MFLLYLRNLPILASLRQRSFCLNAELFPEIIRNADFSLQLFYDRKPDYYDFANKTTCLDHNFQEVSD
jgi:hypothetical protein